VPGLYLRHLTGYEVGSAAARSEHRKRGTIVNRLTGSRFIQRGCTLVRKLMVISLPATRTLGAPRVQVELADELRAKGHLVEFLTGADVYRTRLATRSRRCSGPSRAHPRRNSDMWLSALT
jgi:hypothetical protein